MVVDPADSAQLIRAAREDAGLSQRALADLVGTRQSNIAAVESGRRGVSAEMLTRILVAADYRPSVPVAMKSAEIRASGERLGVKNIRVFGSVARGTDHHESDVDLLVDLDPGVAGFELGAFAAAVRDLTGFEADVVVDIGVDPTIRRIRESALPL